jgi:hypothetical protein
MSGDSLGVDTMSGFLNRLARTVVVASSLCSCGRVNRSVEPSAIADLNFARSVGATVAFMSEDVIAIGRNPGEMGALSGTLTAVQWREGTLAVLKTRPIPRYHGYFGELFPVGHGSLISTLEEPPALLSADLAAVAEIQTKTVIPPVGGGMVAGDAHGFKNWNVYRLVPTRLLLRSGVGELLSLSDDLLVFRANDEIITEKVSGQRLGSFAVPARSACYAKAILLRPDRLYVNGCGQGRVVDFSGKTTVEIPEPDGWGFRYGLNEHGRRMLFDNYTRRIPFSQRMSESVESVLTLGMGPIVSSKGEIIRVVDTETGKICFDLDTPDHQFGRAGEYHADISPSGNFVAVVSNDKLSIYRVPSPCNR